jgi:hypothetical protein
MPTSFPKRKIRLKQFSRSEIPLRALLPCALCEKMRRAQRDYAKAEGEIRKAKMGFFDANFVS